MDSMRMELSCCLMWLLICAATSPICTYASAHKQRIIYVACDVNQDEYACTNSTIDECSFNTYLVSSCSLSDHVQCGPVNPSTAACTFNIFPNVYRRYNHYYSSIVLKETVEMERSYIHVKDHAQWQDQPRHSLYWCYQQRIQLQPVHQAQLFL